MTLAEALPPAGLRLIGGEMLAWSDADTARGHTPVRGAALARLVTAVSGPGVRILVAGPHHRQLVDAARSAGAAISYLLRGYPDATEAANVYDQDPAVEVVCGSLPRFAPAETFDAVIALDGLDRLCSVEGEQFCWDEALDALLRLIRPGGVIALSAENQLGLHALVRMVPAVADRSDAAWRPVGEFDPSAPGSLPGLVDALTSRGLTVDQAYAAFPEPRSPAVLATGQTLAGGGAPLGHVAGVVSAASARAFRGRAVLNDPRRLAASAVRAGLGSAFAASWVVLARREADAPAAAQTLTQPRTPAQPKGPTLEGAPSAASTASPDRVKLPEVIVADGTAGRSGEVAYELVEGAGGGWQRQVYAGAQVTFPTSATRLAVFAREPHRLAGPVPCGSPLETELLGACLGRDLPRLRGLLERYAQWLLAQANGHGRVGGPTACATPRGVLMDGESFALLDPSWVVVGSLPVELVLARGLRQFAVDLIGGGFSHPWPSDSDADGLTRILTAMAGMPATEATMADTAELEADVLAVSSPDAVASPDPVGRGRARALVVGPTSALVDVDGHRETLLALRRQEEQLRQLRAQVEYYQDELTARDALLRRAERRLDLLDGSITVRVGRLALRPVRLARRVAGRVARRLGLRK